LETFRRRQQMKGHRIPNKTRRKANRDIYRSAKQGSGYAALLGKIQSGGMYVAAKREQRDARVS